MDEFLHIKYLAINLTACHKRTQLNNIFNAQFTNLVTQSLFTNLQAIDTHIVKQTPTLTHEQLDNCNIKT